MSNKNKLTPTERLVRVSSVMIALAIVGVCFAIARVEDAVTKIAIFTVSGVTFLLAILFISSVAYLKYHTTHKKNYFLYDKKRRGNRDVNELTFELIRVKVLDYMEMFKRGKKLYVGELFADTPWTVEAMKPLLCYELLYEMAGDDTLDACRTFLGYGMECSKLFSQYLSQNRDFELASKITQAFIDYKNDKAAAELFSQYIVSQREYMEKQVVEYTKRNIDKFMI